MRHPRQPQDLSPIAVPASTAAKLLGAAPSTMRYWCATGIIPARKVGKGWLIRLDELNEMTRTTTKEKDTAMT